MLISLFIIFITLIILLLVLIVINIYRRKYKQRELWCNYNNSRFLANSLTQFDGKYNIYKTKDGKAYFIFRYVPIRYYIPRYEIDILSQPNYGFHSSNLAISHRLSSSRSDCEYKICIQHGYEPQSEEQAKKFSADWAELTWKYIKTGITIDKQLERR